jgi:hypothetical protein
VERESVEKFEDGGGWTRDQLPEFPAGVNFQSWFVGAGNVIIWTV